MGTLPILMIGSLALLFGVFPFDPWLNFIQSTGIEKYFLAASTVTTSCLSIYASLNYYSYKCINDDHRGLIKYDCLCNEYFELSDDVITSIGNDQYGKSIM